MMLAKILTVLVVVGVGQCLYFPFCKNLNGDEFIRRVSGSSNKKGKTSTYECTSPDYRIVGPKNNAISTQTITCKADLTWNQQRPCCEKKKCPTPPEGTNTVAVTPGIEVDVGDTYTYQCLNGYEKLTSLVVECQNGTFVYNASAPFCQLANCGPPGAGINAVPVPAGLDLHFMDVFQYECLEGYETSDELCIICGADGNFIGSPPICTKAVYCNPNPCQNGGTCVEGVDGYCCECPPGSTGKLCETVTLDCTVNGCQNGGTCEPSVPGGPHVCMCVDGYTGDECETDIDDCSPNPCENGGTCTDGINMFTCTCANTWTGATCEEKKCPTPPEGTNTVPVTPGIEVDVGDTYTYHCLNGYDTSMSLVVECLNGTFDYNASAPTCQPANCGKPGEGTNTVPVPAGENFNFTDVFQYECLEGYETNDKLCIVCGADGDFIGTPPNCTKAVYCATDPCQNGGTCVEGVGGYCCECPPGSTGKKCENVTLDCTVNGCQNGGTCEPSVPGGPNVCMCVAGYTGDECETDIDDCEPNPCQNGGTCMDGVNMFTCTCANTWTGATCEDRNCPSGWKVSPMKNCYLIRQSTSFLNRDWFNAKDRCVINGGTLVVLQDLAKADDVFNAGGTTFGVDYWIGGGQLTSGTQTSYMWIDGTTVDASIKTISPSEITSPQLDMLTYRFNTSPPPNYYIFSSSSSASRPYICEQ